MLTLMFVVRPLNVLACTVHSNLSWREKAFLSWVAPRGIVAAAVASLFAERLDQTGGEIGGQLRALVFLVIAATVVALVCGHGSGSKPFQVATETSWLEPTHSGRSWHARQIAEPVLSWTRKSPFVSSWASWQLVHCTSPFSSSRTGPVRVPGSARCPSAAASATV